jgi:hypothetical protein
VKAQKVVEEKLTTQTNMSEVWHFPWVRLNKGWRRDKEKSRQRNAQVAATQTSVLRSKQNLTEVFLERLMIVNSASRQISHILWNPKVYYRMHMSPS